MQNQTVFRLHRYGGLEAIQPDEVPAPQAGPGQVVVTVGAVGVNSLDWKIREGYVQDVFPLPLPAILGVELAGVVTALGAGAARFAVGDRVMGILHGLGAYAQQVVVEEALLARIPATLTDVAAAALPMAALTAWQALHLAGEPRPGMRVLVQAAAGGVGSFAVQFARAAGATVIGTASAKNHGYVRGLGAHEVIDYHTERFEDRTHDIDLVLDFVGDDTLTRSWGVLAPGGAIVSTAAPDIAARTPPGARGLWLMTQPDPLRLEHIAQDVAAGRVQSAIAEVFGRAELPAAVERNRTGYAPGKIVVDFARPPLPLPTLDPTAGHLTLINTFTVEPARAPELVASLAQSLQDTIRHLPGFVSAGLLVSPDGRQVVNFAQWRSRAEFDAMLAHPEARQHLLRTSGIAQSASPVFYHLREAFVARQAAQTTSATPAA